MVFIVNEADNVVRIRAMGQTFVVPNQLSKAKNVRETNIKELKAVLSTISEDSSSPLSSPSLSPATTCVDQSDYQDFLSKFGILNIPLHHQSLGRPSVSQIDSPDDTLESGSTSLAASELASPILDCNLIGCLQDSLPVAVDIPSVGGKWDQTLPHTISFLQGSSTSSVIFFFLATLSFSFFRLLCFYFSLV